MKVSEFTFDSSTAHNKIFTRLYEPDGEPKAVLQISHGMAEHSALYKPFCEYMAQRGFVVVINDHLGHGRSVTSGALYGHFDCHVEGRAHVPQYAEKGKGRTGENSVA